MKEYTFRIGNVCIDVHAETKKEAVTLFNTHATALDQPLDAPSLFQRIQLDIKREVTTADIVDVKEIP